MADGPWTAWEGYTAAIRGAVQGSTLDEVIQWSDRQFARRAAVGRYVRWGGTIMLGSALIYAGLDYFYNYLRRETGTSLDVWVRWPTVPDPDFDRGNPANANEIMEALREKCGEHMQVYPRILVWGGASGFKYSWGGEIVNHQGTSVATGPSQYGYDTAAEAYNAAKAPITRWFRQWVAERCPQAYMSKPPLSEWIASSPDAAGGVRQVVDRYLQDHPIGSPSAPYPGVQLVPVPNPNQWTDNPFTRPDIDTDGDGWPDSIEWYEANRRGVPWPDVINDPRVYPDPNADPDWDGYTNQEELIAGTNPYDPASRPAPRSNPGTRTDTDGDGWPDEEEIRRGTDPRNPQSKPEGTPPLPRTDTDGDGWPDEEEIRQGTDPYNPESKPEGEPPQREEGEDAWPGGPPPVRPDPVELPQTELTKPQGLPELKPEPWQNFIESTRERLETRLRQLRDTALTKVPFAFVNLVGWRTNLGNSPCAFPFAIGPYQAQVDICGTPVWRAATAFRPILAGLLFVGFGFALVRRSLDVQK